MNHDKPSPFAETLRRLRLAAGFDTLAELARRAGLSRQALSKLEAGASLPDWRTVQALARALGVPADAFRDR